MHSVYKTPKVPVVQTTARPSKEPLPVSKMSKTIKHQGIAVDYNREETRTESEVPITDCQFCVPDDKQPVPSNGCIGDCSA